MAGETIARLDETAAVGTREDTGYECARMNAEKARARDSRLRLLQREKTADLTDQAKAMPTGRLRLGVATSDECPDDGHGDHWIIGRESAFQKLVKRPERTTLVEVLITRGALAFEEPFKLRRERRTKDGLR